MSNCIHCNEYVIDDENAGMTDDGSYRLYHPECQSDSIEDLNISLLIAGRNMGYRRPATTESVSRTKLSIFLKAANMQSYTEKESLQAIKNDGMQPLKNA